MRPHDDAAVLPCVFALSLLATYQSASNTASQSAITYVTMIDARITSALHQNP